MKILNIVTPCITSDHPLWLPRASHSTIRSGYNGEDYKTNDIEQLGIVVEQIEQNKDNTLTTLNWTENTDQWTEHTDQWN